MKLILVYFPINLFDCQTFVNKCSTFDSCQGISASASVESWLNQLQTKETSLFLAVGCSVLSAHYVVVEQPGQLPEPRLLTYR
jgi:hypothetical protein